MNGTIIQIPLADALSSEELRELLDLSAEQRKPLARVVYEAAKRVAAEGVERRRVSDPAARNDGEESRN
jgi:hypothetical protein